ncbi:MAG TPA: carboxypeptidase-like regulatory domain-containing protein, partial [Pirellula sp.]|nr:carboxypeptidase-like regulatory domain-containing protein [Pirellula sp.]
LETQYWDAAVDEDGRFRISGLIQNCKYSMRASIPDQRLTRFVKEFESPALGETLDLGEFTPEDKFRFMPVSSTNGLDANNAMPCIVKGRITNSKGEPAVGALVAVLGAVDDGDGKFTQSTLAESKTNANGEYDLAIRNVIAFTKSNIKSHVIARTQDSALTWKKIDLEFNESKTDLQLRPQQLTQVRMVDIEGKAAANVRLDWGAIESVDPSLVSDNSLRLYDTKRLPDAIPSLTTDGGGMLTIPHIPTDHGVSLRVLGNERFAPQFVSLNTGESEERPKNDGTYRGLIKNMKSGEVGTIPLAPAQFFEGVVLLGDSDKPAANARIGMWASQQAPIGSMISIFDQTDAQGRFRLNPYPGVRFGINAYPPNGSAYHPRQLENLKWESGDASKKIIVRLPQAVLAQGSVIDAKTGKPLSGVSVQYHPDSIHNTMINEDVVTGWNAIQKSDTDGKFRITVFPGPGTLLFHAASDSNYILHEMGEREMDGSSGTGRRNYAHMFQKIDPPKPESSASDLKGTMEPLTIKLQSGGTVTAKLVDGNGTIIEQAFVVSRLKITHNPPWWRGSSVHAYNGIAELKGLRQGEKYPVFIVDSGLKLGASAMIGLHDPWPTIELNPCGSAKARFLDPNGKPIPADVGIGLQIVVTPGAPKNDMKAWRRGETIADEDFYSNIAQAAQDRYRKSVTNANGEVFYPALIPGATYRIAISNKDDQIKLYEFVAQSGIEHDMGDIVIDEPL